MNPDHTPDGCRETENADGGAHCICERIAPLMSKRHRRGSAPTAKICVLKIIIIISSITSIMGALHTTFFFFFFWGAGGRGSWERHDYAHGHKFPSNINHKNNNNLLDCHQIIHPAQKHELKSLKCTQKQEDSKWTNTDHCYKPVTVRVD